jgi:uncharacterized iron-regulated membrane protein
MTPLRIVVAIVALAVIGRGVMAVARWWDRLIDRLIERYRAEMGP